MKMFDAAEKKPWSDIPATGPLLRPAEAARYIGYSESHFWALCAKGFLPRPIKIGIGQGGASGVPKPWLDAVITAALENQIDGK